MAMIQNKIRVATEQTIQLLFILYKQLSLIIKYRKEGFGQNDSDRRISRSV